MARTDQARAFHRAVAVLLLCSETVGLKLAWANGSRDKAMDWIGASAISVTISQEKADNVPGALISENIYVSLFGGISCECFRISCECFETLT